MPIVELSFHSDHLCTPLALHLRSSLRFGGTSAILRFVFASRETSYSSTPPSPKFYIPQFMLFMRKVHVQHLGARGSDGQLNAYG